MNTTGLIDHQLTRRRRDWYKKYLRSKNPYDDAVADERADHEHGVYEGEAVVPVLADGGEVPPVLMNQVLVLLRNVPTHHMLNHLLGYPVEKNDVSLFFLAVWMIPKL